MIFRETVQNIWRTTPAIGSEPSPLEQQGKDCAWRIRLLAQCKIASAPGIISLAECWFVSRLGYIGSLWRRRLQTDSLSVKRSKAERPNSDQERYNRDRRHLLPQRLCGHFHRGTHQARGNQRGGLYHHFPRQRRTSLRRVRAGPSVKLQASACRDGR